MSWAERRAIRARHRAIIHAVEQARNHGFEEITPADLRVICLALEEREAKYAGTPAGVAAANVRAKINRNMIR